jgi:F-type H+-transporting ATPase subunit b
MGLVTPGIGLLFWMLFSFLILIFILGKYAWKPVLKMIKERAASIENALQAAEKAKEQMSQLQADNQRIINEAKLERDKLLREAREIKEKIIGEAKNLAAEEGRKLVESARQNIQNEKAAAITEMKNQIASLSVEIAEKILRKELGNKDEQKALIDTLLKEVNLN